MSVVDKSVKLIKGMIALVKGDYRLVLGRDAISVVDPRVETGGSVIHTLAGMLVHHETRVDRSWTDMLLSVVENMAPVLRDDVRDGKTTAQSRESDDELPPCDNPNCPIHGDGADDHLDRPAHGPLGWHTPVIPEA